MDDRSGWNKRRDEDCRKANSEAVEHEPVCSDTVRRRNSHLRRSHVVVKTAVQFDTCCNCNKVVVVVNCDIVNGVSCGVASCCVVMEL